MENVNTREGEEEGHVITLSEAGEILHASYATVLRLGTDGVLSASFDQMLGSAGTVTMRDVVHGVWEAAILTNRLRRTLAHLHPAAHPHQPAYGRQRLHAGRKGGRVPARLLRGLPLRAAAQLRAHAVRLRGVAHRGVARERPLRDGLGLGPPDRLHHHDRRRRGRASRHARRRAREERRLGARRHGRLAANLRKEAAMVT